MNRGLYLLIPQHDLKDLKTTAFIIAEPYKYNLLKNHKDLFETLAVIYYEYKKITRNYKTIFSWIKRFLLAY